MLDLTIRRLVIADSTLGLVEVLDSNILVCRILRYASEIEFLPGMVTPWGLFGKTHNQ